MNEVDNLELRTGIVKICGLRTPKHAGAAALAGAEMMGFIFAPTRRQVTPDEAAACVRAARMAAGCRRVLAVGVFVNESATTINAIAEHVGLDLVQIHGDEEPVFYTELTRPAIKALRVPPGKDPAQIEDNLTRFVESPGAPVAFLIDG
jgi:phosphoribosylanthranilate isomerase